MSYGLTFLAITGECSVVLDMYLVDKLSQRL